MSALKEDGIFGGGYLNRPDDETQEDSQDTEGGTQDDAGSTPGSFLPVRILLISPGWRRKSAHK